MTDHSMTVRLDDQNRRRLQDLVQGRYRGANAAIVGAINERWEALRSHRVKSVAAHRYSEVGTFSWMPRDFRRYPRPLRFGGVGDYFDRVDAALGHGERVTSTDILGLEDIAWLLRISSYPRGRK